MDQRPQKNSRMARLAGLFDVLPERRQRQLGLLGLVYVLVVTGVLVATPMDPYLKFVLYASLPGAALLSWAAFRPSPDGAARDRRMLTAEALRVEPLDERMKHLPDVPRAVRERRADAVLAAISRAARPCTIRELAQELRWAEEAVVSGLTHLSAQNEVVEMFPDTDALEWRYAAQDASAEAQFNERLGRPLRARSDVSAARSSAASADPDVATEVEYVSAAEVADDDARR